MSKSFLDELEWRGMLQDMTPGAKEELAKGGARGYIGFDPTAPSMTIGNYVQLMLLSIWQRTGNHPIVLMGGATGRIGDPSGKDKERQLKSFDELDRNLNFQMEQAKKFLDFEGPNKAIVVNNHDFYKDMNVLDFLRNVGKTLTVSYMMSKDSVKNRLETGLSFTEFSYQLLQAFDFQVLYEKYDCKFQMGGSDQWGNITSGTEFIRRNIQGKAFAITTPLLTKSDGKKFGKSEEGNIWLDANMTSPYKFYQFWINADDADVPKFYRYFSFKTKEEVEALELEYADDVRQLKNILAEEITTNVHGKEAYASVQNVSEILFNKKASLETLAKMTVADFQTVATEIPSFTINKSIVENGVGLMDLLTEHTGITSSKAEAKRAIQNNALSVNKQKIADPEYIVNADHLLNGGYFLIDNGKKNKYIIATS